MESLYEKDSEKQYTTIHPYTLAELFLPRGPAPSAAYGVPQRAGKVSELRNKRKAARPGQHKRVTRDLSQVALGTLNFLQADVWPGTTSG
jgi:hypothetical protein